MLREFYRNAPQDILKENNELLNISKPFTHKHVMTKTKFTVITSPTPLAIPKENLTKNMNLAIRLD